MPDHLDHLGDTPAAAADPPRECQHCRHWGRIRQNARDLRLPTGTCAKDGPATPKRPALPVTSYRDTCRRFAAAQPGDAR